MRRAFCLVCTLPSPQFLGQCLAHQALNIHLLNEQTPVVPSQCKYLLCKNKILHYFCSKKTKVIWVDPTLKKLTKVCPQLAGWSSQSPLIKSLPKARKHKGLQLETGEWNQGTVQSLASSRAEPQPGLTENPEILPQSPPRQGLLTGHSAPPVSVSVGFPSGESRRPLALQTYTKRTRGEHRAVWEPLPPAKKAGSSPTFTGQPGYCKLTGIGSPTPRTASYKLTVDILAPQRPRKTHS